MIITRHLSRGGQRDAEAALPGYRIRLGDDRPLMLDCGIALRDFPVAYQMYGRLNDDRSNVILVCHALTGDQFAAEPHPVTGREGWWDQMIGPGRPLDTNRFCVLCVNVLDSGNAGCHGHKQSDDEEWVCVQY